MSDLIIKELIIYTVDGKVDMYKNAKMEDSGHGLVTIVKPENSKYLVFYYNRNIVKKILAMEE